MKKIFLTILIVAGTSIFSVNNREAGNIFYEDSYNGYGVDQLETDLSVEDLYISFHNDDSILLNITGYAPGNDIEDYLEFGVYKNSFYIESRPNKFWGFNNYSIKVEITLPGNYIEYYDIKSSTGEAYINSPLFSREFKAQTSTGDLYFESITSDRVTIESSTGEKEIGEIITEDLYIQSSTGDTRLGVVKATKGRVRSSTGEVYITSYTGDFEYSSSTGDIEIDRFISGNISADTSTGEVIIALSEESGWDLNITTSTGDIESSLPIMVVGNIDEDKLQGSVNGGGYKVRIKTSTGDITLR